MKWPATIRMLSLVAAVGAVLAVLSTTFRSDWFQTGSATEKPAVVSVTKSPLPAVVGREPGDWFQSIPSMLRDSSLVIRGTVVSAEKGHTIGDPSEKFYVRDVVVDVDETFFGPAVEQVSVDQNGYTGDRAFEIDEIPWAYPGDTGIWFLQEVSNRPEGHYPLAVMPGQYLVKNGLVTSNAPDPVAKDLSGRTLSDVSSAIRQAVTQMRDTSEASNNPGG